MRQRAACLARVVPGQRAVTRTRTWAGLLLALLLTILVGVRPSPARADGDPASDVLVNQALFLPADAAISVREQLRLVSLLDTAKRDGVPIRLAIISSPSDLGAISELWHQPRAYAHFLGLELSLIGRAPLLVVMPNGVGYYSPGHFATAINDLVGRIPASRSGSVLVNAAQVAVISVADAAHVHLVPPGRATGARLRAPTPWRPTTDRVFGLAILAALASVFAGCLAFTRRRSAIPTIIRSTRRRLSSAPVRAELRCGGSPPPKLAPRQSPLSPIPDELAAQLLRSAPAGRIGNRKPDSP